MGQYIFSESDIQSVIRLSERMDTVKQELTALSGRLNRQESNELNIAWMRLVDKLEELRYETEERF